MKKLALTLAAVVLTTLATDKNASAELPQHLELKTYFEMDVYVSKMRLCQRVVFRRVSREFLDLAPCSPI